jgi:hypothetical protein
LRGTAKRGDGDRWKPTGKINPPRFTFVVIYTFFDSSPDAPADQPEQLRLWDRNWRAQGWTPKLLTIRHARRSKLFKRYPEQHVHSTFLFALHTVGGGWMVRKNQGVCVMKPRKPRRGKEIHFDYFFYMSRRALEIYFRKHARL